MMIPHLFFVQRYAPILYCVSSPFGYFLTIFFVSKRFLFDFFISISHSIWFWNNQMKLCSILGRSIFFSHFSSGFFSFSSFFAINLHWGETLFFQPAPMIFFLIILHALVYLPFFVSTSSCVCACMLSYFLVAPLLKVLTLFPPFFV